MFFHGVHPLFLKGGDRGSSKSPESGRGGGGGRDEKFHFKWGVKIEGGWKIKGGGGGGGITIVCSVFTFFTEVSFSYKISYSYSTRIFIVFRLNVFLLKHFFEINNYPYYSFIAYFTEVFDDFDVLCYRYLLKSAFNMIV